ncbi:MAG: tRNA (adenosine(37)-N6)-threonylcarbamoyltransferase complex ATPase subunit type 1 TsaE [Chryseobacterium sp. 36-9]|jgi:tRNA threonylcarbamoyladenosine biosynthesis protein TsaE|uniref:tRNA threonylcarbamoyladenosine biosynthesis protein TsaE n=1 Tax=Epilithonimonas pallida TaxID=373671 RepID=A0ABY1R4H5_9FLAO|nr:tRNA (adenosine(37)-N6)-threonylcarbamoyltransferase complex ATPase subunit type 1 TsaE [Epilithonimonas pallida]OJX28829.1 MAG: tRNA (adenosine(37)-N6)-threonylcarbamoyltransferase complex ATPase subunit type 1 TsaE [Chryseobacterium sp. 36-9]SMP95357.1 tRNA threonylcarbamoyladenosine biosynthesis protein TsaE [Epilithonimonas pallida]
MVFQINTLPEWKDVVNQIIPNLQHNILLLKGNLGAGKTTFTQYLLKEFGSDDEISSPTYSIVNEYDTPKGKVYHFDLYRLKDVTEAYDFGIEEYLDNGFLSIIEWPEIYMDELEGYDFHEMTIENTESGREIEFN